MDDNFFALFLEILAMGFALFYEFFKRVKAEKKSKQLEVEYDELLKQVELLTHENNMLKERGTDMI